MILTCRNCDPYYGTGTLYRLDLLEHCSPIRFLTRRPEPKEVQILPKALTEWQREHGAVEFRKHVGPDLHDRYILTDEEIILLGHGLKDIGNGESFIVRIHRELAADLIKNVKDSFDRKWAAATLIV